MIIYIFFFKSETTHLKRATHSSYDQSRLLSIIQTGTSVLDLKHEFTSLAIIRLNRSYKPLGFYEHEPLLLIEITSMRKKEIWKTSTLQNTTTGQIKYLIKSK